MEPSRIASLLRPYLPDPAPTLLEQLSIYLELLLKWNARTNLTALRTSDQMVTRHFGESLFLARHMPSCSTFLDLGSGAGFPGVPVQLLYPHVEVTLAESQGKKASFLREVVRVLDLPTTVIGKRAEDLVGLRTFDVVALRAVDNPVAALRLAKLLLARDGSICHLGVEPLPHSVALALPRGSWLSILSNTPATLE